MGQKSDVRKALKDLGQHLKQVFKGYSRQARDKAWDRLISKKGKKEVEKLLVNPKRPLNQFAKLAFKEWFEENLLIENTISQLLKVNPIILSYKQNGGDPLKELFNLLRNIISRQAWTANIKTNLLDSLSKWLLFIALDEMQEATNRMGSEYDPRSYEFPGYFSGYIRNLIGNIDQGVWDFLAYAMQFNPQIIKSKLNNPNYTLENLKDEANDWHEQLKYKERIKGPEGRVIKLSGMLPGWFWVSLDKDYCPEEGDTMGHCGNSAAVEGDNIYSLRDSNNIPHLTFIVNNGILGESKGFGNSKPSQKYHKQIISLLLGEDQGKPIIEYIKGGGYLDENNFKFEDLNDLDMKMVLQDKPYINDFEKYLEHKTQNIDSNDFNSQREFLEQIFRYPFEGINPKSKEVIIAGFEDMPDLIEWLKENTNSDLQRLPDMEENIENYWDISDQEAIDVFEDYANEKNEKSIEEILDKLNSGMNEPEDLLYWVSEDQELSDALSFAAIEGYNKGAENDMYDHVFRFFANNSDNGLAYISFDPNRKPYPWQIELSYKDLEKLYKEHHNEEWYEDPLSNYHPINQSIEFNYENPYNGYSGFDKEAYNDHLSQLLYNIDI